MVNDDSESSNFRMFFKPVGSSENRTCSYTAAEAMGKSKKIDSDAARIKALEATLEQARRAVREAATALFRIHPDDLHA